MPNKTKLSRAKNIALKLVRASSYFLLSLVFLLVVFAFLIIEDQPAVLKASVPSTQDVVEARKFVRGVRSNITPGQGVSEPFIASENQLNSVIKLGTRWVAGFRVQLRINEMQVMGTASMPVPYTQQTKWVNFKLTAPEFEGAFTLSSLKLGDISIPPKLALSLGRVLANVIVGNRFGDRVLSAATSMQLDDKTVTFELMMDEMGSNGLMRGIFGTLRGSDMPGQNEIDRYYLLIRNAMDRGQLPNAGSYLPYLQFTLEAALQGSRTEGIQNAYTSAMFALTMICGARDFTLIVGGLVGNDSSSNKDWKTDCTKLSLNGRIDSRRHFTTAAAIQAASNRGFAASLGEFKELYDTVQSGGFDFTDIAANNSGIRMSNTLMSTPLEAWTLTLARIEEENDVIVSFDGIPPIMDPDEFLRSYNDIESTEYLSMLALIESKIDNLALNRQ